MKKYFTNNGKRWMAGVGLLVAGAVWISVLVPRVARAQAQAPAPITVPALNTNIFGSAVAPWSNTVALAPVPSGVTAVRRVINVLQGQLCISPTNIGAGQGTLTVVNSGSVTPYYTISNNTNSTTGVELTRTPFADGSTVLGIANGGSTTTCIYQWQITGYVTTNAGGSYPGGATGTTSFGVGQ